nr:putative ribonuclease H-like domain-containing protein [Tanacetum cinerariifolium]
MKRNTAAYKEYYAIPSGEAPPKMKASMRKTHSSSDTTMLPPMTISTRLLTLAKGKQPAKSFKAKDKGTGIILGVLDVPTDESDKEISWKLSDEDDVDNQSEADVGLYNLLILYMLILSSFGVDAAKDFKENILNEEMTNPQVVSAAKLPILNPNEFDLWKMRIEHYFLMTDYSLWEIILNGDSPAPTRVIEGVVQPVAPTTLKFNIHKDAKTLMEAIDKSTNDPVSAVAGVSAASAKIPVSILPNVDTLSNAVIYSFFYDWSFQAEKEPNNYALMTFTSSSSSSSNNAVPSCSKDCTKAYATLQSHYDKYHSGDGYHAVPPPYTGTFMPSEPNLVFYDSPNVNETVHTAFNVELSFTKPDKDLSHRPLAPIIEDWVSDSEDASEDELPQNVPSFVQHTKQVKTPRPSIKTIKTSIPAANHKITIPKPKSYDISRNRKACFVCKSLTHLIKDCDFYEKKMAQTPPRNHAQRRIHQQYARMTLPNPQRHVVPTSVLTKSKLVPITADRPVSAVVPKPHVTRPRTTKTVVTKPHSPPRRNIHHSPSPKASTFLLKVTAAKAPMVNGVKGNWGNPQHALKDNGVIDSGCSRHMTGNMSYLSDFEEINGGYVAFGGNPKGVSHRCVVLSPEFKLPDENQVLFRVPRENNMYNVDLKNIVPSGDLTCLFAKATLDESNLWHRRLGHINFKTINKLVKDPLGKFDKKADEGFLVGYSVSSKAFRVFNSRIRIVQETLHIHFLENTPNVAGSGPIWLFDIDTLTKTMNYQPVTADNQSNPSNIDDDDAFRGKKPEFEGEKPESEVYVSPSSKFEDFSNNSINEVNATDSLVPAVAQISTNSTNIFSDDGPSNAAVSPTHGKSSYVNPSQYPDDPNMPELEDITYSDDEEDVDAEADFTNLETTITVSLIPTTRVHKDHPVTQIIGDLSLAAQTRSITRVVKDQGGLTQINNEDFDTCMFEEGIDYEEVVAPVARIEAIRLFLAYAFFMGFMVYQMDVKSAFLYGTIEEEVYVCQPLGFEDPDYPDKVYKVVKALYRLHQAPKACLPSCSNEELASPKVNGSWENGNWKKVVITEATIREALRLNDAESIDCLPNEEIFIELSRMGYEKPSTKLTFYKAFSSPQWKFLIYTILQCMSAKRTSWNEFSSSMASAVICLSTGRKFNFSKYIFDSLVRNVDSSTKFYMYPRFLQLMIRSQVGDLSLHSTKYSSPALTQNMFANMIRVGKGFSGVDTPLFEGIIVAQQDDDVADEGAASVAIDDVSVAVDESSIPSPTLETDTLEKDKNKAKNDKTKHGTEKIEKDKVIRSQKSKVKARGQQKSTTGNSKSNPTKPKPKCQEK